MAGTIVVGPCFFDPPPGDFGELQIVNDTAHPASVAICDSDNPCRVLGESKSVAPGQQTSLGVESCNGDTVGVFSPGASQPFSCLTAPTERDDGSLPPVRLSAARSCG